MLKFYAPAAKKIKKNYRAQFFFRNPVTLKRRDKRMKSFK